MLPEIRTDLFGKNPNRKFYNVSIAFVAAVSFEFLTDRQLSSDRQAIVIYHQIVDVSTVIVCVVANAMPFP